MTYLITSPYFWFFYFFIFLAVVESVKNKNFITHISFFVGLILLVLLIGLRTGSPDQNTYVVIFDQIPALSEFWLSEYNINQLVLEYGRALPSTLTPFYGDRPYLHTFYYWRGAYHPGSLGLGFLISVLKSIGLDNAIALFMFVGMLVVSAAAFFCMRFSPLPILSFCLFFSWFLGAIRHALAMGMFMIFLVSWLNRRRIAASMATIFGVSFHFVLLPCVLLLPVWEKMANRRFCFLIFLMSLAIAILFGGFLHKFFQVFGDYVPYFARAKYDAYALAYAVKGGGDFVANSIFSGVFLKQSCVLVSCLVFYGPATVKYPWFKALTFWYTIGVSSYLLFLDFSIVSSRFSHVITVVEIALIPMLLCSVNFKRYNRAVKFAGVLAVIALCLIQLLLIYGHELREYEFIGF